MNSEQPAEQIIVYGHQYCSQAMVLAAALQRNRIDHEWRDILNGDPAWKDELRALARGNLSVPTVVFPDGGVLVEPWPDQVLKRLGDEKRPGLIDRLSGLFNRDEETG